jgi:hypothetical protein
MTADPAELLAARTLMAFILGSHIILVPLGAHRPQSHPALSPRVAGMNYESG